MDVIVTSTSVVYGSLWLSYTPARIHTSCLWLYENLCLFKLYGLMARAPIYSCLHVYCGSHLPEQRRRMRWCGPIHSDELQWVSSKFFPCLSPQDSTAALSVLNWLVAGTSVSLQQP